MKLSKKSRYGLRALIDLTINSRNGHVALKNIAERNDISPQYLEQVFASLRKADIVKSVKGPQGGYLLSREPEKITISEILEALEGNYLVEAENDQEDHGSAVIQELIIDKVNKQLGSMLADITLHDLEKRFLAYNDYEQDMYYI